MNYRSVMAFGTARRIDDPAEKNRALRRISEHLMAGRWEDVREPYESELKQTAVLEFAIEEASAKVRTGPPLDDEEDYALPVWAGVLPVRLTPGTPEPDPKMPEGVATPEYVASFG